MRFSTVFTSLCCLFSIFVCLPSEAKTLKTVLGQPVKQVGLILIKKTGQAKFSILLRKNVKTGYWSFPIDYIAKKDDSSWESAKRIAHTQSLGRLTLTITELEKSPFIYSQKFFTQIFVTQNFAGNLKQMHMYAAVPIERIMSAARCYRHSSSKKKHHQKCCWMKDHKNKVGICLEKRCLSMLAKEYKSLEKTLEKVISVSDPK